ncbi:MAG: hypothetical protein ACR2JM_15860 [Mycobacterium sp.]
MTQTAGLSPRSLLIAGMSAAVVGAAVVAPVAATPQHAPVLSTRSVALTSLGSDIEAFYNAVEPWAAYGAELAQYALSFIPGLWWVAPGIDLAYFSIEPLVQAAVYSFADLVDLNFAQIPIDIQDGIYTATQNFVNYSIAWIGSLVPFPPIPPIPPLPGAAVTANPAAASVAAKRTALPAAAVAEVLTETAPATEAPAVDTVTPAEEIAAAVPAVTTEAAARVAQRPSRGARTAVRVAPAAATDDTAGATASAGDSGSSGKSSASRASRGAGRAG